MTVNVMKISFSCGYVYFEGLFSKQTTMTCFYTTLDYTYTFPFKCLLTFGCGWANKTNSSIYCNIITASFKPGIFIHFKPLAVGLSLMDLNGVVWGGSVCLYVTPVLAHRGFSLMT